MQMFTTTRDRNNRRRIQQQRLKQRNKVQRENNRRRRRRSRRDDMKEENTDFAGTRILGESSSNIPNINESGSGVRRWRVRRPRFFNRGSPTVVLPRNTRGNSENDKVSLTKVEVGVATPELNNLERVRTEHEKEDVGSSSSRNDTKADTIICLAKGALPSQRPSSISLQDEVNERPPEHNTTAQIKSERRTEKQVEASTPVLSMSNSSENNNFQSSSFNTTSLKKVDNSVKRKEKRVEFSASSTSRKKILLKEDEYDMFVNYMTQPVEQYSLLNFYGNQPISSSSNETVFVTSRRWIVRRLTHEESKSYREDQKKKSDEDFQDNFFRLAVPLMPLVGLDLTPVIDLEVISPLTDTTQSIPDNKEATTSPNESNRNNIGMRFFSDSIMENLFMQSEDYSKPEKERVKMRSLRVALLSSQEEINQAMKISSSSSTVPSTDSLKVVHTSSSPSNKTDARGVFGKIEEWIHPHLKLNAKISWSSSSHVDSSLNSSHSSSVNTTTENNIRQVELKIESDVQFQITVPKVGSVYTKLIPPSFVLRRFGSIIVKKVLGLTLPRFLIQLEKDFLRWSSLSPIDE